MRDFAPQVFSRSRLGLVFVCGALSLLSTTSAFAAEVNTNVVITDKAKQHFRSGVALLQDPDGARYDEAYLEFRAAYAESPSWKILGNLGISAMKLERDGEAIEAFEIYLRDGGQELEEAERAQVQRDLELLKANVTWVTLSSTPEGGTVLDTRTPVAGRAIENRYDALAQPLRVGLHSGRHTIKVELEGYEPGTWTIDARGGEQSHVFELKKKVEGTATPLPATTGEKPETKVYDRPTPTGVYIGLGATVLLAGGATVTGLMALDQKSTFNSANGSDPSAAEAAKSSGETLNLVTDILIGSAVVAAGVTTYLYVTRPEVEAPATATRVTLRPVAGLSGGGFLLSGQF